MLSLSFPNRPFSSIPKNTLASEIGIGYIQTYLKRGVALSTEFERQTLRICEAAKLLGIGRNQAYDAAKSGQLPVIRIGKRLLVLRPALDRMLNRGGEATSGDAAA
jgi:excisionase family DNA binding protein